MEPRTARPDTPEPDARVERCRRVLEELSEAGMRLVRALDPDDPALSITDAALAYSRLSRAIRLNILLDLRLDALARGAEVGDLFPSLGAAETEAPSAEAETADPVDRPEPAERPESAERLDRDAPDEALRLIRRPLTEVVAAICRGYGLSPEETAAAQAPFAALVANDTGPPGPAPRRTAGVPPANVTRGPPASPPPRNRNALNSRLLAGTARPRGMDP